MNQDLFSDAFPNSWMDLLDKLNERLVLAVGAAGTDVFPGGLTIADVYQRLIPYRAVRGQLGVVELAEYEHAMLRLLSGERQYVEVLDPDVRIEVQRELASLNPILGIYRDYSGTRLRLAGGPSPHASMSPHPGSRSPTVAQASKSQTSAPGSSDQVITGVAVDATDSPIDRAESAGSATAPRDPASPGTPQRPLESRISQQEQEPESGMESTASARAGTVEARATGDACGGCGRVLPDQPEVRFCPFCGLEQGPAPCGRCGAAMDRSWSFCTRCGTSRDARYEGAHA